MSNDERDNPGIKVPPPLIYLLPLLLGLILDRKAHSLLAEWRGAYRRLAPHRLRGTDRRLVA